MSFDPRRALALLVLVVGLATTGCSQRSEHHASHGHYHDYRHGYYNPVDGYFHDDHWHRGSHHRHSRGCGHAVSYHYY